MKRNTVLGIYDGESGHSVAMLQNNSASSYSMDSITPRSAPERRGMSLVEASLNTKARGQAAHARDSSVAAPAPRRLAFALRHAGLF
jgi:hypothetical protein